MAVDYTKNMMAEAGIGEDGTDHNVEGDQTGIELRTRRWFWYDVAGLGWATVFRLEDPALAERVARFMERITLNGFVGYDQADRKSIDTELQKVGNDPSAIHNYCETDCSMTVYEAVKYATGIPCLTDHNDVFDHGTELCPDRDEATGLCGDTYFSTRNNYPTGQNLHYYMTRVLPLNGIKVSAFTLSGMDSGGNPREDFYAQNMRQLYDTNSGTYAVNGGGKRIDYVDSKWKTRYYETPYERIGITKAQIDAAPNGIISGYTQTIGGVKYYNEFGRAVASFNSDYASRLAAASEANPGATSSFTRTSGSVSANFQWREIQPYNALTYEQIARLGENLHVYVGNGYEAGYLMKGASDKYPVHLKRGDVIISRIRYYSPSTMIAYVWIDGTRYAFSGIPKASSGGHVVIWI